MSYNIQSQVRAKFASVAAMLAVASSLAIGEEVDTTSYYDGWAAESTPPIGGNKYIKVAGQTPAEDNGSIIYTDDGNHLKGLFPNSIVYLEQFGLTYTSGVITGDYTTVATNAEAFAASANLIVDSEKSYNITVGNTATDNTANMTAAQAIAAITNQPISLPCGSYPINRFIIKAGVKILCSNQGEITFTSATHPIIELEGGVTHDGTEFHGTLECTGTGAAVASGLLLFNSDGTTIESVNFDYIRFKSPLLGVNGALIVAGNSANDKHSWIKQWSMKYASYDDVGRMGVEVLNQSANPVITNVTIGAGATFTATGLFANEGQTVQLVGLVGDAIVEGLNEAFYIVTNVTATTFQLKDTAGDLVDTTGGTYTSGGDLNVYRAENIDLKGSRFLKVGQVDSSLGMGFSGDGPILNVNLEGAVVCDTPQYGLELVGVSKSKIADAVFNECTGEPLSMTGKKGYGNTVNGCKTIGFTAKRVFISDQKDLSWLDNNIESLDFMTLRRVEESTIKGGKVITQGNYALILDNSPNNTIKDVFLDNSRSDTNFSCLRFFGADSTGNRAEKVTLLKGPGGTATDEDSGATNNTVEFYRTSLSDEFALNPKILESYSTLGTVDNWPRLDGSEIRELNNNNPTSGVTAYRIKLLRTTGSAQPIASFDFTISGRNNNNPRGGKFGLVFGAASDFDATPVFWTLGGTSTLGAVVIDGSGYPYWDITLPVNNGQLNTCIRAQMRDSYEDWEITQII